MKRVLVGCLALFISLLLKVPAGNAEKVVVGKVKGISGLVSIIRAGKTKPAFPNDIVYQNDVIITGSNGAIGILLEDNTLISMGPISRVAMNKFKFKPAKNEYALQLNMDHGTFVYQSGLLGKLAPYAVELNTPVGRISMLKKDTSFRAKFAE